MIIIAIDVVVYERIMMNTVYSHTAARSEEDLSPPTHILYIL